MMDKTLAAVASLPKPTSAEAEVFAKVFKDDGTFPNSKLPFLLYQKAVQIPEHNPAAVFEKLFAEHGWCGSWRNGIYPYHHYHSITHEVLGVYSGSAKVQIGGKQGELFDLSCGDVLVIPAGVAHKKLGSTADFGVVGAYPGGRSWDTKYGGSGERPEADENIARVPLPKMDPVYGADGALVKKWSA